MQAEVWLASDDLAVRQIDTRIQITTTENASSADETIWTITRTLQFDAGAARAITEPAFDAGGPQTDCNKVTEISEAECRALVALYESTGGEEWTDNVYKDRNSSLYALLSQPHVVVVGSVVGIALLILGVGWIQQIVVVTPESVDHKPVIYPTPVLTQALDFCGRYVRGSRWARAVR